MERFTHREEIGIDADVGQGIVVDVLACGVFGVQSKAEVDFVFLAADIAVGKVNDIDRGGIGSIILIALGCLGDRVEGDEEQTVDFPCIADMNGSACSVVVGLAA